MNDFVTRNQWACGGGQAQPDCHKHFHYTDLSIQRSHYRDGLVGTHDHDLVASLRACIAHLRGRPAKGPMRLGSQREALLLLTHWVGDLHQPLHVGAVYLDRQGQLLDPELQGFTAGSPTYGGNALWLEKGNLHQAWDAVPAGRWSVDRSSAPSSTSRSRRSPVGLSLASNW